MVRSRGVVVGVVALAASLLAMAPVSAKDEHGRHGCPPAESLVPNAHLHTTTLAAGVTLASGTAHDAQGSVVIHVLRARLSDPAVSVAPLVRSLAERSPLSRLAAGHHHLVAASNTGYFDFETGAPDGPFITDQEPTMLSVVHQAVVGIDSDGRAEAGDVWLTGTVTTPSSSYPLAAVNERNLPGGISLYTRAWGPRVFLRGNVVTRPVTKGVVRSPRGNGTIPAGGQLLVATSRPARRWLDGIGSGTKLTTRKLVKTSAAKPFVQAYGVGSQIVARAGQPLTGFGCNSANTRTPARTAVGYADAGRQLVLAFVNDRPGTTEHGLDDDQMSELMVQLKVSAAYTFDGSGSTELLARSRGASSLTLRTYPADGQERPMPLGLGVFSH